MFLKFDEKFKIEIKKEYATLIYDREVDEFVKKIPK